MGYFDSERGRAAAMKRHHGPKTKPAKPPIDKDVRRLRAYQIIQRKIVGETNEQIAKALNISVDTVHREMRYAKRMGLLQAAEERLLDELAPAAIQAYLRLMAPTDADGRPLPPDQKSLEAATNVLNLIEKLGTREAAREAQREGQKFSLAAILARRGALDPSQGDTPIEVTTVNAAESELPAPPTGSHGAGATGADGAPGGELADIGADAPATQPDTPLRLDGGTGAPAGLAQDPQAAREGDGQDGPHGTDGTSDAAPDCGLQPFPFSASR